MPFPFHTAIWIVLNMGIVGVIAIFLVSESLSRLDVSSGRKRRWQGALTVLLITWFIVRMALGHSRIIAPAHLIGLSFFVIFSAVGLAAAISPIFREAALSIPQDRLIGVQFVRVGGSIFLTLLDMRLLPAQFALPAGYGDILVGLTAPIVVWALNHHKPYARQLALAWNALGMLDFAVALGTGIAFIGPYVRQLARTGHSIAYLDYVLMIPGFAVPILTLLHIGSIIKLRQ